MEKKIVPALINFSESVPTPINRSKAEIGAVQVAIHEKKIKTWAEIGAILANHFGNKRKTRVAWILFGLLFFGASSLFAAETVTQENYLKQVLSIEKRGLVNVVTSPGEVVNAYTTEKKDHPKIWLATYLPRLLMNFVTRFVSGANDVFVLPWYAWAAHDTTPLTRHFDFPDYVWQKE